MLRGPASKRGSVRASVLRYQRVYKYQMKVTSQPGCPARRSAAR